MIIIYSDVHANLPAFEAFKTDSRKFNPTRYIFIGDAVNYGGSPNECVDGVVSLGEIASIGNHDAVCCGLRDADDFNDIAQLSVDVTKRLLTNKNKAILRNWGNKRDYVDMSIDAYFNHSAPGNNDPEFKNWDYIFDVIDARRFINEFSQKVCFIGHSHEQGAFVQRYGAVGTADFPINLNEVDKAIVNVGSVGQPRDGDPRGKYVTYDPSTRIITLQRFEYDILAAQAKIREVGLPEHNAQRLAIRK